MPPPDPPRQTYQVLLINNIRIVHDVQLFFIAKEVQYFMPKKHVIQLVVIITFFLISYFTHVCYSFTNAFNHTYKNRDQISKNI